MRSRAVKFKQLRHFTAAALMLPALAGCAAGSLHNARKLSSAPQPLAHMVVATPDAQHDVLAQLLAGELALNQSNLKSASSHYGKAMAFSDDPQVAARAAGLAIAVHDEAAAQRALDRWQALGASSAELAKSRAALALDQGNATVAQRQLALLTASGTHDAWRDFGRVLLQARDHAQAGNLLEALATPQRLPADERAWLAMSEMGDKFGRHAYAMAIADAAVKRFHSVQAYAWAAQMKFKAGDKTGARELLRKALASKPHSIPLRLAYASLLSQTGDDAAAVKLLDHGTQSANTYAFRVGLAARAKDQKTLVRIYHELLKAPAETRQHSAYLIGQLAEMQHLDDAALDWYGRVDDGDAQAFDASLRSAVILHSQGHDEQAHQLVEQLQLDYMEQPDQLRKAYQVDAELYLDARKYAQAELSFNRALQVMPNDPALLYGRGLAYAEAGRIDQAVIDFRRLLKIKPGDVAASNALGFTLADANRDLPEATRLIAVARKAKPNDPSIADSWGWLQYRLGHLDQAEQTLRRAWQAQPAPDIGVHLGEVLWKQGDHTAAQAIFAKVAKLDPDNASLKLTLKRLRP